MYSQSSGAHLSLSTAVWFLAAAMAVMRTPRSTSTTQGAWEQSNLASAKCMDNTDSVRMYMYVHTYMYVHFGVSLSEQYIHMYTLHIITRCS